MVTASQRGLGNPLFIGVSEVSQRTAETDAESF